jgi:hypothetical protein
MNEKADDGKKQSCGLGFAEERNENYFHNNES